MSIKLICPICNWEDTEDKATYKQDNYGSSTLVCINDCQLEDNTDLEIVGTTTIDTLYENAYGVGRLLWYMNEELEKKYWKKGK